jgi:bifunctional aspartokinase / homoserine dehydrogenase 1
MTDGEFGGASILLKESSKKIKGHFSEDSIMLFQGFMGYPLRENNASWEGGPTILLLPLANLLDADSLDVWKDVGGFQTGDPKIVKEFKNIDFLSYNEAAELSYFGAKILHPRTVEPLQPKNIPVRIFNIDSPSDQPGTVIGPDTGEDVPGSQKHYLQQELFSAET